MLGKMTAAAALTELRFWHSVNHGFEINMCILCEFKRNRLRELYEQFCCF